MVWPLAAEGAPAATETILPAAYHDRSAIDDRAVCDDNSGIGDRDVLRRQSGAIAPTTGKQVVSRCVVSCESPSDAGDEINRKSNPPSRHESGRVGSRLRRLALFCAVLVALRNHLDRENLVESLVIRHAVQGLLVRSTESNGNEIKGCGNFSQEFAISGNDLYAASSGGVNTALRIHGGSVAANCCKLALVGQRTIRLDIESDKASAATAATRRGLPHTWSCRLLARPVQRAAAAAQPPGRSRKVFSRRR